MTERDRAPQDTDSAGFTLIELMVALVIIAVGIMALSGVQASSSRDVYSTGRRTRALAVAEEQVEIARSAGYASAVADSGLSGPLYWVTHVDSADVELRSVTVTVTWPEAASSQSVQLMTLLARR